MADSQSSSGCAVRLSSLAVAVSFKLLAVSWLIYLLAAVIAGDGIAALDKDPRGLGILESGNQTQYCKIDIYCSSVLLSTQMTQQNHHSPTYSYEHV